MKVCNQFMFLDPLKELQEQKAVHDLDHGV
jgi:hypothetical protein